MTGWHGPSSPRRRDAGSATVLAVALASVLVGGLLVVGQLGRAAAISQQAATAADLAALSAASAFLSLRGDPCDRGAQVARLNGADAVSCLITHPAAGAEVEVTVRSAERVWPVGAMQRSARAGVRPVPEEPVR